MSNRRSRVTCVHSVKVLQKLIEQMKNVPILDFQYVQELCRMKTLIMPPKFRKKVLERARDRLPQVTTNKNLLGLSYP